MTRRELRDVATEFQGTPNQPSKIGTGLGYSPKRIQKEVRRAEPRATPITQRQIAGRSSADLAQRVQRFARPLRSLVGRVTLTQRARQQSGLRPEGRQNIGAMFRTMRKDPSNFPASVTVSPDPTTKGTPGHMSAARPTTITGRTRQAVAAAVNANPGPPGITLPSGRYAASAARFKKAAESGKLRRVQQRRGTSNLPGTDPRLVKSARSAGQIK